MQKDDAVGVTEAARDAAREWMHTYGIDTRRYTAGGGDHPMMDTLPAAFERYASARPAPSGDAAAEVDRLRNVLNAPDRQAMGFHERHAVLYARATASERRVEELQEENEKLRAQTLDPAVRAKVIEHLPIYEGRPDSATASVRVGLLRAIAGADSGEGGRDHAKI